MFSFIKRCNIIDYAVTSVLTYVMHILMVPFSTRAVINCVPYAYLWLAGLIPITFIALLLSECLTTKVFRFPANYTRLMLYQCHRIFCIAICMIILCTLLFGEYYNIVWNGLEHWNLLWQEKDGTFTFTNIWSTIRHVSICVLFFCPYYLFLAQTRVQESQIRELQELNQMLETDQEVQDEQQAEEIVLNSDSRDSLAVNPRTIVYVESVANYLNVVYFNGEDLCQKRLRSSLRDAESVLEVYPFMVRTHRAFLVNIHFITQVSGNSAGMKISLFSCDKVIPVSRSHIDGFKAKLQENKS